MICRSRTVENHKSLLAPLRLEGKSFSKPPRDCATGPKSSSDSDDKQVIKPLQNNDGPVVTETDNKTENTEGPVVIMLRIMMECLCQKLGVVMRAMRQKWLPDGQAGGVQDTIATLKTCQSL